MKKRLVVINILLAVVVGIHTVFPAPASGNELEDIRDNFTIQNKILDYVRNAYVDTVSITTLLNGSIQGMMDELDPHSSYMPFKAASEFKEKIRGGFEGIGITFAMIDEKITIIQVIEDGPSEKAGLKARDKIVKINDKDVIGVEQEKVKELLRGPANSSVQVHVERPGADDLQTFTIVRDRVNLNSVSHAYMLNRETGYVKISKFTTKTHYDVNNALRKLGDQGMKQLVLDLRSNSGGSLEAAVRVVDFFIKNKGALIVETRGTRPLDTNKLYTSGDARYAEIPLIVLINHGSASASEIVAGALQDHDRALIAGRTSFGKGLVMNSFTIRSGKKNLGSLVLSVAHYYTPSGRLIQRPYDEGKEQYIREGFDDYDPNAVDATKTEAPVFHTDLGREVYGGGGITPDRNLEPLRQLNTIERALRSTNVFFEFADDYLLRHEDIPESFEEFLTDYVIPREDMLRFKQFAEDRDIDIDNDTAFREELEKLVGKYDLSQESVDIIIGALENYNIDLNENLFDKSTDFIEREIKQEIARIVWSPEARFRVWYSSDTELISALAYFGEAEELLKRRIAMGNEQTEYSPAD